MEVAETLDLLDFALGKYRDMPYAEVANKIGHEEASVVEGASGRRYLMVKRIRWGHRRSGAVKVMACINDETDEKDLLSLRWHLIRRPDKFHADSLS